MGLRQRGERKLDLLSTLLCGGRALWDGAWLVSLEVSSHCALPGERDRHPLGLPSPPSTTYHPRGDKCIVSLNYQTKRKQGLKITMLCRLRHPSRPRESNEDQKVPAHCLLPTRLPLPRLVRGLRGGAPGQRARGAPRPNPLPSVGHSNEIPGAVTMAALPVVALHRCAKVAAAAARGTSSTGNLISGFGRSDCSCCPLILEPSKNG